MSFIEREQFKFALDRLCGKPKVHNAEAFVPALVAQLGRQMAKCLASGVIHSQEGFSSQSPHGRQGFSTGSLIVDKFKAHLQFGNVDR